MATTEPTTAAPTNHLTEVAVDEPAIRPRRRSGLLLEVGLLLALPIVVFFVLRVEPFFTQNGVDPFIYLGYAENSSDLVSRFGYLYFAVRFGLILPARLFSVLFGDVGGHLVLRYLLALLSAGSVWLLARRLGCRAAGWFAAVLCLTSPVFLRALMTIYSDTTGVPFLLTGVACLLMPSSRRWAWAAAGGLLLGFAVHSNPVVVPLLVVVFGARLAVQLSRREWRCLIEYVIAGAGVLAVTVFGIVFYEVAYGEGDILRPSVRAFRLLTGNATSVFRSPTLDWLGFSPHLYLAPLVTVALVVTILTRRGLAGRGWFARVLQAPTADVFVMLVAAQAMFAWQQFVGGRYILETFYYASYLFPFVVLGVVGLMVELAARRGFGARGVWIATAVVAALPIARNLAFDGLELWVWPTVPIMAGLVVGALLLGRRWPGWTVAGGVALAASLVLLAIAPPRGLPVTDGLYVRQNPRYELAIGNASTDGLDYFKMANQLIEAMPRWADDPGSMIFWYPTSGLIDSLQSTYIWRSSSLHGFGPPMPALTDEQRALLLGRTPRHLVLMAETPEQLEAGRQAILDVGLQPVDVADHTLSSGPFTVYVERLTFEPAPCDQPWNTGPFLPGWFGLTPC